MINFKTLLASALLVATTAHTAFAQNCCSQKKDYPYAFVGVQGGAQTTFTNYKASKLITPIGAVSVGGMFTPVIGARLHVSGINEKGGLKSLDKTYDYKFVTSDIDLMLNLCNTFAPKKHHVLNAYLIGGFGLGYAWDNDDLHALSNAATENLTLAWKDNRLVHNFRVGMQLEAELCRAVGLNLEVTANNYHDRFNSKLNGKNDWQVQALLGLNFKFGRGKAKKPAPVQPVAVAPATETHAPAVVEPKPEPKPAPKPEPKPEPKPAKVLEEAKVEVFFTISNTTITPTEEAKLSAFANWMKSHPTATATITGYADKGTGNAEINMRLSKQRAESVMKMLTDKYGIAASRLSCDYKGDLVQPFKENNSNRVVIGIAKEK